MWDSGKRFRKFEEYKPFPIGMDASELCGLTGGKSGDLSGGYEAQPRGMN
jgi:hypothetical protein